MDRACSSSHYPGIALTEGIKQLVGKRCHMACRAKGGTADHHGSGIRAAPAAVVVAAVRRVAGCQVAGRHSRTGDPAIVSRTPTPEQRPDANPASATLSTRAF